MARSCSQPLTLSLIILLAAAACLPADNTAGSFISDRTSSNGLHVILAHDPVTDLAAFHLALEVSTAELPREQAALIETVQQLMLDRLRATVQDQPDSPLADALAAGATIAISAEREYGEARAAVPTSLLADVLQMTADLFFGSQQFTEDELAAAKQTLVSSYEASLESTTMQTVRLFERALHGASSSAHDVPARLSSIADISIEDIEACRSRMWVPSRAYLTVVGPQTPQQLREIVNRALGEYAAGNQKRPVTEVRLPTESAVRVGNGAGVAWASLMIGVPLPPYGTREFVASQVAYLLLTGPQGRLTEDRVLRQGFGLVLPQRRRDDRPAFDVMAPGPGHMPYMAVHLVAAPAYIEDARVQVLGHVEAIRRGYFSDDELQTAKTQLTNQYALAYNTYLSRAQLLNLNALFGGEAELRADFPSMVASITAEDVVSVAEKYFAHHAIGLQMPGD